MLRDPRHGLRSIVLLGVSVVVAACGGGDPSGPPAVIGVSVSPSTATVGAGETREFTATVTNSAQGVSWSATGGSISGSGATVTYTAPFAGGTYTVRATSTEDATKSGTASATVTPIVISLTPAARAAYRGEPVTIAATVAGSALNGITWTASCGTVTGTGSSVTWTAPETTGPCTVTARSVADATASGTATMTVREAHLVSSLNDASDGNCNYAHCSLREAITAANAQPQSDSIHFQATASAFGNTPSTITLTSALPVITTEQHIVGPGPDVLTINAAATSTNQRRVIEVNGAIVSLAGVRLRGGIANGGAGFNAYNGANVKLTNVMVVENESRDGDGGGVFVNTNSQVALNQVIIDENKVLGTHWSGGGLALAENATATVTGGRIKGNTVADGWAGGIKVLNSKLTMTGTTVEGNSVLAGTAGGGGMLAEGTSTVTFDNVTVTANSSPAGEGGGLRILASVSGSIANSTVSNNTANSGSGIVLGNVGAFTITNTTVNNNTSATRAGGVWLWGTSDVTLTDCTIRDNIAQTTGGGGLYLQNTATARLTGTTISGNKALGTGQGGGGVQANVGTTLTMTGGAVEKNEVNGFGAGIYAQTATISLTDVPIRQNAGPQAIGAGIAAIFGATVTVTGGSVTENVATTAAGGGLLVNGSNVTLTNVTVQGNDSDIQGGAIQILGTSGTVTLDNVTIRNNHSDGFGGGIGLFGTMVLNVSNSLFEGNTTDASGAAIGKSEAAQLTISDTRFLTNSAMLQSGALHLAGTGNATVRRSTFSGNTATTGGGAITNGGPAVIETSVFNGNSSGTTATPASGQGGAIFSASLGNSTIRNSTISGNTATTLGGGISVTGPATLQNLTIVGNSAATIGGGIAANNAGAVTITNSLLANNLMGTSLLNCGIAVTATITSQGYNLSDNASCPSFTQPTDKLGTEPGINTTLADNGGPTRTHAVLTGSALINAGNSSTCPTTDQRGFSRQGVCDIGAFEFGGIAPTPNFSPRIGATPTTISRRGELRARKPLKGVAPDPVKNGGVPVAEVVR